MYLLIESFTRSHTSEDFLWWSFKVRGVWEWVAEYCWNSGRYLAMYAAIVTVLCILKYKVPYLLTHVSNKLDTSWNTYCSQCTYLCYVPYTSVILWTSNNLSQLTTLQQCFCASTLEHGGFFSLFMFHFIPVSSLPLLPPSWKHHPFSIMPPGNVTGTFYWCIKHVVS